MAREDPLGLRDIEALKQIQEWSRPPVRDWSTNPWPPRKPYTEEERQARFNAFGPEQLAKAKALRGASASLLGDDLSNIQYDPRFTAGEQGGYYGVYNPSKNGNHIMTMVTDDGEVVKLALGPDQIGMFDNSPTTLGHEMMHRHVGEAASDDFMLEVDAFTQPDKEGWDREVSMWIPALGSREAAEEHLLSLMRTAGPSVPDKELKMGAEYKHLGYPDYSMVPDEYAKEQYRNLRNQQSYWARELRDR